MSQAPVTFICGMRGSGKTTRAKRETVSAPRLFVYDPMSEYTHGVVTYDIRSFCDYPSDILPRFRLIHRPVDDETDGPLFLRMVLAVGNCTVVLEEADTLCNPRFTPPEMKELLRRGRHYNITVFAVSRNPSEVSRDVTRQSSRAIIYSLHEPNDLDYFRSFGIAPERITSLKQWESIEHLFGFPEKQK